jgi:Glycosyl transferase family 2
MENQEFLVREPEGLAATETEQKHFFERLREGYQVASERTGEIVRDFRVAGTSVRLRFAGEALTPAILPGLAHPVFDVETKAAFEISIWDSDSTGVSLASPPRPRRDFTARGNIWGFDSSRYRSALHVGMGSVNVMDRETRRAVFWVPSHQHLPAWVLASPLRSVLHWWMELNGRQLVHAAAVGYGGRGVLIPGRGGSGKSSTALACLLAGMDFVSDDYVALALDPEPRIYRLYTTAKLDRPSLSLYPELAKRCRTIDQRGFDKVVMFLEDGYGTQLKESLPLDLVLKPHLAGVPETRLGPVDVREIERALSPETLMYLPHTGVRTVEFLDRVSHEVPSAAIYLGTDRARIVTAIRGAIEARTAPDSTVRGARDKRPYISVIVHLSEDDLPELRMLAEGIEAQGYPRTELIVVADGAACAMKEEAAKISGNVRFFTLPGPAGNAEAWNRGIRESFAEFLMLIEPGDRFPAGALDSLVQASEQEPGAAWFRGRVVSKAPDGELVAPLRGALIRKSAFRECGLFSRDPFLQRREHQHWLRRLEEKQLTGQHIEVVTLQMERAPMVHVCRPPEQVDLRFLKSQMDRRRQKTPA